MKRIAVMATTLMAIENCVKSGNTTWEAKHRDRLQELVRDLPSGSGIDAGTRIDDDRSTPTRIVLIVDFHHMDEHGYYDGWTEHSVIVTPTFDGITIRVSGKDRNDIKDYLATVYSEALSESVVVK